MFDAWYNVITKNSICKFDLAMTDTDSFLFKVSNAAEFWGHMKPYMDYSNYQSNHPLHSTSNKAKLGYFKDEFCGKFICEEFIGLRSKCYALKLKDVETEESKEKKICKGLGRSAIKNRLKFDQYKKCISKQKNFRHEYHSIRSMKHNVKTMLIRKKALNFLDTKRWLFDCAIHSAPYGSSVVKRMFNKCPRC